MRRISRVPKIPADQAGAALVGVLATVGLYMLGTLATSTLLDAVAVLLAGVGVTCGLVLMAWYWFSVLTSLVRWFRYRQLDKQDAAAQGDYDYY